MTFWPDQDERLLLLTKWREENQRRRRREEPLDPESAAAFEQFLLTGSWVFLRTESEAWSSEAFIVPADLEPEQFFAEHVEGERYWAAEVWEAAAVLEREGNAIRMVVTFPDETPVATALFLLRNNRPPFDPTASPPRPWWKVRRRR